MLGLKCILWLLEVLISKGKKNIYSTGGEDYCCLEITPYNLFVVF